jgi:NAD(P)H-nitrite reductase large subunit
MEEKILKDDLLNLGAIVQRDRETYAIAPHLPGGLTDVATLKKLAEVAEKYQVKAVKVTSAQRIALVGIAEADIEKAWEDLGMTKGAAIGLCVRSIKICPGTAFCKRAKQNSVSLGLKLDAKYHGYELPNKLKIGVSGCANNCSENAIKDIGFMGTAKGFTVTVGGNGGGRPRLSEAILTDKSEEECLEISAKIIDLFKFAGKKGQRLGRFIEAIGMDKFKAFLEANDSQAEAVKAEIKEINHK